MKIYSLLFKTLSMSCTAFVDWWIASQLETMPTKKNREYSKTDKKGNVVIDKSQKWSMLREKAKKKVAESVKCILNHNDQKSVDKNISLYNSLTSGLHNYYKMATHVSADFDEIGYPIQKRLNGANHNNKGCRVEKSGEIRSKFIAKNYGKSSQMRWIG